MITEDYVSFETAKLLKEKGFDEPCYQYYMTTKTLHTTFHSRMHVEDEPHFNSVGIDGIYEVPDKTLFEDVCSAPSQALAMRWLREVHNIFISILQIESTTVTMEQEYFFYRIQKNRRTINIIPDTFKEPEQAAEAAIKYCLENLI